MIKPNLPDSYRERLYQCYVSGRSRAENAYHDDAYRKWGNMASGRFKGWLPSTKSATILDLGCGHGNFLYLLESQGYQNLTGVDLSEEQLQKASDVCRCAKLVKADSLAYLRQPGPSFEFISALNIIEHFRKDEILEFLNLIRLRLTPGGRVLIETPNAASPWFGSVAYGDLTHEWFFTPSSLNDTLKVCGFKNYQARSIMHYSKLDTVAMLRLAAWEAISSILALWNIVETGGKNGGIYTRVFVATATLA